MRLPSGAKDGKALLFGPEVMRRKSDPPALTMPTWAPPFTGSIGFFPPASKSRKAVKRPIPKMIRLPSGDHCGPRIRSEEHTSELQSQSNLVCRLLLEKKKKKRDNRRCHPDCATED